MGKIFRTNTLTCYVRIFFRIFQHARDFIPQQSVNKATWCMFVSLFCCCIVLTVVVSSYAAWQCWCYWGFFVSLVYWNFRTCYSAVLMTQNIFRKTPVDNLEAPKDFIISSFCLKKDSSFFDLLLVLWRFWNGIRKNI